MNLNANNVNFQGRTEVLYGLKKAAQEAQYIGRNSIQAAGPRPLTKNTEINQSKGALDAYCDMIVRDELFVETMHNIPSNITNEIKETLSPIKNEFASVSPHNTFAEAFKNAVQNANIKADTIINSFLEKIKM